MPSSKVLEAKKAVVSELSQKIKGSCAGVVVSYKGINVEDDTKLRRELRESKIYYQVVKNTLLGRALSGSDLEPMSEVLSGSTAIAMSESDHLSAAKILCGFAKDRDFFQIKSGFIDGRVIDGSEVKRLASLPAKEVLIAQALAGLNAPIQGFANVLNGTIKGLVVALSAIAKQKESA